MLTDQYLALWPKILSALAVVLESPLSEPHGPTEEEELYIMDIEEAGYQASFSKLSAVGRTKKEVNSAIIAMSSAFGGAAVMPPTGAKPAANVLPEVDPKRFLGLALKSVMQNHMSKISAVMAQLLPDELELLNGYIQ
ncbi:hypothetical protein HK102_013299 [Quaeritorhiza haematococci]|nr:hypothetical protein HK102_013299 [Quaeritorhiza haematococci]